MADLGALPADPKGNPLEIALWRHSGDQADSGPDPMGHPLLLSQVDVQVEIIAGGCASGQWLQR